MKLARKHWFFDFYIESNRLHYTAYKNSLRKLLLPNSKSVIIDFNDILNYKITSRCFGISLTLKVIQDQNEAVETINLWLPYEANFLKTLSKQLDSIAKFTFNPHRGSMIA